MSTVPAGQPFVVRVAAPALRAGAPLHALWQDRLLALFPASAFAAAWPALSLAEGDLLRVTLDAGGAVTALQPLERQVAPHAAATGAEGDALRWRRPAQSPSRMARLGFRHRVLRELRAWLDVQGFLELDTPNLVRAPSPEPLFEPIAAGEDWLITSPEFQLKRLLVGGFEHICRIGAAYRGAEVGQHHNPEFTLLEWYRVHPDPAPALLAADLAGMLRALAPLARDFAREHLAGAEAAALDTLAGSLTVDALPEVTVAGLVRDATGVELRNAQGRCVGTEAALRDALTLADAPEAALAGGFTQLFSALWVRVETALPSTPLLVVDWPAPLASLARLKPGDPSVAERMELYLAGVELANGFVELIDAAEQRRRFEADCAARAALGLPSVPLDEPFLRALEEGLPPCVGMALGIDRLVMLLCGAEDIRSVLPLAWDEL